jgi:hypothetical protein
MENKSLIYIENNNLIKDIISLSACILLCIASFNIKENYYIPSTTVEDGTIIEKDSTITILIPDIR